MKSNLCARMSITIDAPVHQVWEALTCPEIINQYFFGTEAISDWKPGSPLIFKREWQDKSYEDKGTIIDAEPGKLLRYTYGNLLSGMEDKPGNDVIITYHLFPENEATTLEVMQENIPDQKMREQAEQNWQKALSNLKQLLEYEPVNYF